MGGRGSVGGARIGGVIGSLKDGGASVKRNRGVAYVSRLSQDG